MIGMYGPVLFGNFGGVSTFDDMQKSVAARWGKHDLWQSKPLLEYAGPDLIELRFKMPLIKPFTVDPLAAVVILEETMDLALPYPLIIGMKPMGRGSSLFVMQELRISPKYFFRGGGFLGVEAEVNLKEYPDAGLISTLQAALGGLLGGGTSVPVNAVAALPATLVQPEAAAVDITKNVTSVAIASRM